MTVTVHKGAVLFSNWLGFLAREATDVQVQRSVHKRPWFNNRLPSCSFASLETTTACWLDHITENFVQVNKSSLFNDLIICSHETVEKVRTYIMCIDAFKNIFCVYIVFILAFESHHESAFLSPDRNCFFRVFIVVRFIPTRQVINIIVISS